MYNATHMHNLSHEGQSKVTASWLIYFDRVGSFDCNLVCIWNEPSLFIAYKTVQTVVARQPGQPLLTKQV